MHRAHQDLDGEACALDSLGYIAHNAGRLAAAESHYREALAAFRVLSNPYEEANTLDHLGDVQATREDHAEATATWRQALDIYRTQRRAQDVARIQAKLPNARTAPAPPR